jgi:flagellar basal-body rod protein FlgG
MVTKEGFKVLDEKMKPIVIDLNAEVTFDKNGALANGDNISQLMVVRPENLQTLQKDGSGLYSIGDENEMIHYGETTAVQHGYLETSNVNAVIEMSHLIEANRMVGMYQKVMDTQMNELNRDAIEKVAVTRS